LAKTLELRFAYAFHRIIWNTLADGNSQRLFIETRDVQEKKVSFSALNLQNYDWLWKDLKLEEGWWVSLAAIAGDVLLFTIYTDTSNPDKKSLLGYDVVKNQMIWWYNGFSFSNANSLYVKGIDTRFPAKEIVLDASTGHALPQGDFHLVDSQNFPLIRPFQYEEGTAYFGTVKHFLKSRAGIVPVATIDYLEYEHLIILSVFTKENDLANYLYVFDSGGEMLFRETLGEKLKGVGLDTFFIYADHLIFVRNKNELITYKIL